MRYLYFIIVFMAITVMPAFCYLDPGTGSMIVSAIIGGFATVIYMFKGAFYKVIRFFRGNKGSDSPEASEDSENS